MLDFITLQEVMHAFYEFKANEVPGLLPEDLMKMRLNFLFEELAELAAACGYSYELSNEFAIRFVRDTTITPNPAEVLDALVDIQVVLLGTVHLMGFFNKAKIHHEPISANKVLRVNNYELSLFEEAYNRVWQANMKKVVCKSNNESKRGCKIDLKKPKDWKAPVLTDLVEEFIVN
jgi:predicted HAD superfamily Cof-like phosphohydrolase